MRLNSACPLMFGFACLACTRTELRTTDHLTAEPARSAEPSPACPNNAPHRAACPAVEQGFVEADVDFILATPEEMNALSPYYTPSEQWGPHVVQPTPSADALKLAEQIEQSLPMLSCTSITDVELEALGDVLGLVRIPPKAPRANLTANDLLRGQTSKPPPEPIVPPPKGSHFTASRYDGTCSTIYEFSPPFVEALRRSSPTAALAKRWTEVLLSHANPYLEQTSPDPRSDADYWAGVAKSLHEFTHHAACEERRLFVRISFDC